MTGKDERKGNVHDMEGWLSERARAEEDDRERKIKTKQWWKMRGKKI